MSVSDGIYEMMDLSDYQIAKAPDTVYYIPEFITVSEEKSLLDYVSRTPAPRWTQLANRRLQNWGGVPHPKGMIAEKMPDWLQEYVDRVNDRGVFGEKNVGSGKPTLANHVLLNEYQPGQGIMPHLDGPMFHPTISTISLGSHTVINFYNEEGVNNSLKFEDRLVTSILVQPRSLLVLQDSMYNRFLHGIEEIHEDKIGDNICNLENSTVIGSIIPRNKRVSLTIRHVPKTSKMKLKLGR